MPAAVWNRLKNAEQLYYRLHVTDDIQWGNYAVTIRDSQAVNAPSIPIVKALSNILDTLSTAASVDNAVLDSEVALSDSILMKSGSISSFQSVVRESLQPAINGPERYQISEIPPTFFIQSGANQFYAIEVTTHPELFLSENEQERTVESFFRSSDEIGLQEMPNSDSTTYSLPETIWDSLQNTERLYYRLVTSSTPGPDLTDVDFSISDVEIDQAPWIDLFGHRQQLRRADDRVVTQLDLKSASQRDEELWRSR